MGLRLSRRALLAAPAAFLGCGRRKATGYPGYCFVAARDARSLAVIDLATFRTERPIRLDAAPSAILPHPRLAKVFALAADSGAVYEVDANSLRVSRRARAGVGAVTMLPTEESLWVLYREPAVLVEFPFDSLQPRRRIRLPFPPDDFDLKGNRAAIVSRSAGAVSIAKLDRAAIERTVAAPRDPAIVRFQQKGAQVLAGSPADRSLLIIDAETGALFVRLPLPIEPRHFCFSEDEGQIFVSGPGMDAVVIVYPYQTEIGETILAGRAPAAMAMAGSYLLVTNPETNTVTALDIDSRRLAAVVSVGREPRHIVITPDNQYALVLNEKSADLAVIRIASLATKRYKTAPLFTMLPVGDKPVSAGVVTIA
ncbi:MAG: beta-propeller fold lactonase family protein [Acidobacteriia bacterium]|nr:beta-propeller fold lactonase family protein [Terriglobia bacterium]